MITHLGLIAETLQRAGRLDPADLFRLPQEWQMLHLAHTRNLFTGQYEPPFKGGGSTGVSAPQAGDMERWRQRDRGQDIEQARTLLQRPDLPAHVRRSAEATLAMAGGI